MDVLDIILLVCFIPGIILGFKKGFIAQLVGFVSIFLGTWLSFRFSDLLGHWLKTYLHLNNQALYIIAFVIIFIAAIIILNIIGKIIEKLIKVVLLGWLNRLLGVVFGVFTTFVVLALIITLINYMSVNLGLFNNSWFEHSMIYCWLRDVIFNIFPHLKNIFIS